jgi:hypothetical protein
VKLCEWIFILSRSRKGSDSMASNTITINGKHYDAKTGRLITASPSVAQPKKPVPHKKNGAVIDGFSRRPHTVPGANAVHAKTEKSKTLRRDAVRKPNQAKIHSKTVPHAPAHHKPPVHQGHTPENHQRAARAATVAKSKLISRFGPAPAAPAVKHHAVTHVPVAPAPVINNHRSAPIVQRPGIVNPFDDALQNATSHQQAAYDHKKTRRQRVARALRISPRTVSFGSFVIAGLLLGGVFVYQNIPNLAMRVAAARSGVSAGLPGYKPAGFALSGPIKYSPGKISISYRSTTDERTFQVTQSSSEWNNETLLDNFVAIDRRPYQTYQDKGKTIYIYDGSNATWVDSGVWYQVEGASSLNSDQLLRIANSL